jgi:hypothetical protein
MIKNIMLTIVTIGLTIGMASSYADDFKGDAWAKQQLDLTRQVMTCVGYVKDDFKLFLKECAKPEDVPLPVQQDVLNAKLKKAIDADPESATVGDFIKKHFKDKPKGQEAMTSVITSMAGIKLIGVEIQIKILEELQKQKQKQEDDKNFI